MRGQGAIVLTGMMGAGKTTCGRRLSQALGWPFVDLDLEVERRTGKSPGVLLEHEGEAAFRLYEREALRALVAKGDVAVIALGGGTWHQEQNKSLVQQLGTCAFLDLPHHTISARLQGEALSSRPLLKQAGALAQLLEERHSGYLNAGSRVDADGTPEQVAARVLDQIGPEALAPFSSLSVQLGERSYPIWIGQEGVEQASSLVSLWLASQTHQPGQIMVVTDETVGSHYLDCFINHLKTSAHVTQAVVPVGESSKSLPCLSMLWDQMLSQGLGRGDLVIALGGGVVGDLAGFAAATLKRGVRLVQVPTTVLSQVDSSVGGKTGINHALGKNLLGAFHQPSAVIMALGMLKTLEPRQIRSGIAEMIKASVISSESALADLEAKAAGLAKEPWKASDLIAQCCGLKADIVARDEHESGARALLNLGHSFGHAMEAIAGFGELTHGEAVGLGMLMAARSAVVLGLSEDGLEARLRKLLIAVGLPVNLKPWWARQDEMVRAMGHDKKRQGHKLTLVIPRGAGDVILHPVAVKTLHGLLARLASMEREP